MCCSQIDLLTQQTKREGKSFFFFGETPIEFISYVRKHEFLGGVWGIKAYFLENEMYFGSYILYIIGRIFKGIINFFKTNKFSFLSPVRVQLRASETQSAISTLTNSSQSSLRTFLQNQRN